MKSKKILSFIMIFLISVMSIGCSNKYKVKSGDRKEMWIKDIEYLGKQLPKKHKNLFFNLSEESFNEKIENLKNKIENLKDEEIKTEIYKIVASVGDGHTFVYEKFNKLYPLSLYSFKEGIYTESTIEEYKQIIGCKLIKINDLDIESIKDKISKVISHENEAQIKNELPQFIIAPDILYGLKIIDNKEKTKFTFLNSQNKIINIEVKPIKINENSRKLFINPYKEGNIPMYLEKGDKNYWYKYLKDENTLYFKYNSCMEMEDKSFKVFSKELIEALDKHNPEKFIIDLRDNGGGNSSILDKFIDEIKNHKINKENKLFVIVGRRTFSSAILNSIDLRNKTEAIFVGEPTGGKPNHYGEVKSFKLPNMGMEISYSTKYFKSSKEDTPSFMPDRLIEPSINDFINSKDSVLQYILNKK
ncbi:S41 family peptidase [Clostridium rectalis]|uniref:S41 family peptidase n=1 Tax=Clostridium rectalis TaxID=2040295 RepID=UPI000F633C40|nr:S41 family peptidase [Clostridium rectalis]